MKSIRTLITYAKWKIVLAVVITAAIAVLIIGYDQAQAYQSQTGIDLHLGVLWDGLIVIYLFSFTVLILANWTYLASKLHDKMIILLEPGVLPDGYRLLCGGGKSEDENGAEHPTDFLDELDDAEDERKAQCFIVKNYWEVDMTLLAMRDAVYDIIEDQTNYSDDPDNPVTLADKTWKSFKQLMNSLDHHDDPVAAAGDAGLHYTFIELEEEKHHGRLYRWSMSESGSPETATYHEKPVLLLVAWLPFSKAFTFKNKMKVPFGMFDFKHGIIERVRFSPSAKTILDGIPKLYVTGCSGYDKSMIAAQESRAANAEKLAAKGPKASKDVPSKSDAIGTSLKGIDPVAEALRDMQAIADWSTRKDIRLAPELKEIRNLAVKRKADSDEAKNADLRRIGKLRYENIIGQFRKTHRGIDGEALPALYLVIYFLIALAAGFCGLWIASMALHWTI